MGNNDWNSSLASFLEDTDLRDSLLGMHSDARVKQLNIGKTAEQMRAITDMMSINNQENAAYFLSGITKEFIDLGWDPHFKKVQSGSGYVLQMKLTPHNNPEYAQTHDSEMPIVNIGIDKDGFVIQDGMLKSNILTPQVDKNGVLHMRTAVEASLRNVAKQLSYQGNKNVIRNTSNGGIADAIRYIDRITNKEIRKVMDPSTASSQYNDRALQDLKTLTSQRARSGNNDYRKRLSNSVGVLDHMFDDLIEPMTHGTFKQKEIRRDQINKDIKDMTFLFRTRGMAQGYKDVANDPRFAYLLNSNAGPAIIKGISQLVAAGNYIGELTEENAIENFALNGIDRAWNFTLPKGSRKLNQTQLVMPFKNNIRDMSTNKGIGAGLITKWEKEHFTKKQLHSKEYDTLATGMIDDNLLQRAKAELRKEGKLSKSDAAVSISQDALLMTAEVAKQLRGVQYTTKNISNSDIDKYVKEQMTKMGLNNHSKIEDRRKAVEAGVLKAIRKEDPYFNFKKGEGQVF